MIDLDREFEKYLINSPHLNNHTYHAMDESQKWETERAYKAGAELILSRLETNRKLIAERDELKEKIKTLLEGDIISYLQIKELKRVLAELKTSYDNEYVTVEQFDRNCGDIFKKYQHLLKEDKK